MKYKVGDKVRVRKDLVVGEQYGGETVADDMVDMRGMVVTIEEVDGSGYGIKEGLDDYNWTDEMFEPVEEELTAEEAIRILGGMCRDFSCCECPIYELIEDEGSCDNFRAEKPDKVIEVLKQWKKDHEKKPIETERAIMVRVLVGNDCNGKCVHEEEVPSGETWERAQERVLKEYCENHEGKYISTICGICRVKE